MFQFMRLRIVLSEFMQRSATPFSIFKRYSITGEVLQYSSRIVMLGLSELPDDPVVNFARDT